MGYGATEDWPVYEKRPVAAFSRPRGDTDRYTSMDVLPGPRVIPL